MIWKFKENLKDSLYIDDFWYDLLYGGYIQPSELLTDEEQINNLLEAIELVHSFETALRNLSMLYENK